MTRGGHRFYHIQPIRVTTPIPPRQEASYRPPRFTEPYKENAATAPPKTSRPSTKNKTINLHTRISETLTSSTPEAHFLIRFRTTTPLLRNNRNDILVRHDMAEPDPLRHMPGTSPPHQRILERLLQRPMHLVAHLFDRRLVADDQRFAEVGFDAFSAHVRARVSSVLADRRVA